ncbi:MAG: hypothetical protein QGG36_07260 [Pirellulaceae bacterium]|jgi:hypothetical protein|nr:hypothetical protein [Pirellulaceae bacterium]MDP7015581.1 hypothetical protein [Pirellulaceae bacterium]
MIRAVIDRSLFRTFGDARDELRDGAMGLDRQRKVMAMVLEPHELLWVAGRVEQTESQVNRHGPIFIAVELQQRAVVVGDFVD